MKFFLDFLHQKAPKAGKEIPQYFRRALTVSETLLIVYFAVCFFLYPVINHRWEWIPLLMIFLCSLGFWLQKNMGIRVNILACTLLSFCWVSWNVWNFGWSSGTQHFLTLLLVLVFFNIYEHPLVKLIWFLVILVYRILMFSWSQQHSPVYVMESAASTVYQTVNTVSFFLMLASLCIIFSTSIQETERQLRIRNQTLYKEAGTDPLTGLPNRRAMIERIDAFRQRYPDQNFCVAIADIDFFKNVNDTYGHNCGDYTLVKLTELFTEHAGGNYSVCRWGGEEFCFFLPERNLDEAWQIMNDLCMTVERMKLEFEGNAFSITITIGVEENDFASPMDDLLKVADEKLYMGKKSGRNRVVV